jgi:sigma-B regulation protein RsbU (phosphoserine phosphatase)
LNNTLLHHTLHSALVIVFVIAGACLFIILLSKIRLTKKLAAEQNHIGIELAVAKRIQSSLLPCKYPPFPGHPEFDVYAVMVPAEEVGGDFYDFFLVDKDTLCLVIADVSDKGIPAALFMVITKILIKTNAQTGMRPSKVFETVNAMLCDRNDAEMFATAFMGYLDIPTGRFTFVNAGHNPPLIKQGGSFKPLAVRPGFVLASIRSFSYSESEITLGEGDALCLYTDGVTEAMSASGELFSVNRLIDVANSESVRDLKIFTTAIKDAAHRFASDKEQADDITLLSFRYDGGKHFHFVEFKVVAEHNKLKYVLQRIAEPLYKTSCTEPYIRLIELAAEEVFVNIAHYAYEPGSGDVLISLRIEGDLTLTFADRGKPFNPVEACRFDINKPAEERVPGGLGIFMAKNIMDEVSYRYEDGYNILTLRKRLA